MKRIVTLEVEDREWNDEPSGLVRRVYHVPRDIGSASMTAVLDALSNTLIQKGLLT